MTILKERNTVDSEGRRFKALDFLLDYSKGTLWWVDDRLWNEAIARFVWKRNGKSHPGLSISGRKANGLYDVIPMLIGTTKAYYGMRNLEVWHVENENAKHYDKPTHFAPLRPCRLRFNEFGRADGITMNAAKPRIDRDEARQLDAILAGEEVRHD